MPDWLPIHLCAEAWGMAPLDVVERASAQDIDRQLFLMSERTKRDNAQAEGKSGGLTPAAPDIRGLPPGAQVTTRSL